MDLTSDITPTPLRFPLPVHHDPVLCSDPPDCQLPILMTQGKRRDGVNEEMG